MKTRTIILSFALMFALPLAMNAQVGNLLRNKLNKVVNAGAKAVAKDASDKADSAALKGAQKVDAATQDNAQQNQAEQADQSQAQGSQQGSKPSGGINLGGLLGGKVTSKYNESYSFKSRMYMQMEVYDKKDVTKGDYFIYFTKDEPNAGFETKMISKSDDGQEMTVTSSFVYDGPNKSFIMMTDMGSMRIGIISAVPDETAQEPQAEAAKGTLSKTGNSKVIAGYKCDEYLYREGNSKEYTRLWFTKDLKLTGDKRAYSKTGMPSYYNNPELKDGTMLAMESYNDKNELSMKSETKEINFNFPHSISTTGFSFRQMDFGQAGQQKK